MHSCEGAATHPPGWRAIDPTSEETLRLMVGSVVDYAIFMLDTGGRVISWNEGARRLKQYEAEEIVGRHFSLFYPADDRDAGRPQQLLQEAMRNGRVEDEGWRVRKDGTSFWADVVITALRGPDGDLRGFCKVTRDLSERKAAEDALRAALDGERQALVQVRETDRRRHDLIAMVAHDLRSPVGVLHGTTDMLVEDWERLDDAARLHLLRSMLATTDRLRGLVDDVLDVARIDAGTLSFATTAVELMPVVRRAAADVDRASRRVRVATVDDALRVRGDERRIWQILTNLLSNALKFSPPDSVVDVSVSAADGEASVAVTDRGIGICEADQTRLFQAFARFGPSSARQPGTGLGLYIAQALATAQGGAITVQSAVDAGSKFCVTLPIAAD